MAKPKSDLAARFWSKVDTTGECWEWIAGCKSDGYGEFRIGLHMHIAHRVAWELTQGTIPEGLFVLHRCDNRRCVRPEHLFLGTHQDNMNDMNAKGRGTHGDRHPARYRPDYLPHGDEHWTRRHPERVMRGEQRVYAKLTKADILAIRQRASHETRRQLGTAFGVNHQTISKIVLGQRWAHIEDNHD